jgi:hypothetical protein
MVGLDTSFIMPGKSLMIPEGIPTLTYWWGVCGHMSPRAMLAVAYANGRASHARQVKGDDPNKKYTLVLQVGGFAWG